MVVCMQSTVVSGFWLSSRCQSVSGFWIRDVTDPVSHEGCFHYVSDSDDDDAIITPPNYVRSLTHHTQQFSVLRSRTI
jgi:hypothetical protein